jgi:YD repeat-containing protein
VAPRKARGCSRPGQQLATYDANQNGSFQDYNAAGQQVGSGLATGSNTSQVVNALGQLTQITDGDNNITRTLFDLDGRQVAGIDPLGHFSYVSYNQDGQVTQEVDRDARIINNTYDAAGRLTTAIWLSAAGVQTDALSYNYDHANNITSQGNSYGSYSYTLDPANRITQQTDAFNITVTFTYDHNGNTTQVQGTASGVGTVTFVYDGDNSLTSERLSGGPNNAQLRLDIIYTAEQQISTLKRYTDTAGNNLVGQTQDTYDPAGKLTEEKHTAGSTTLEDF